MREDLTEVFRLTELWVDVADRRDRLYCELLVARCRRPALVASLERKLCVLDRAGLVLANRIVEANEAADADESPGF